jgi:sugar transferase (PEP-CTERM system associated)
MISFLSQYISSKSLVRVALESVLITLALWSGAWLRFWNSPDEFDYYTRLPEFAVQILVFVIILQMCFYYGNLYDLTVVRRRNWQLICLGQSLGVACVLLGVLYYVAPDFLIGRGVFFIGMGLVATFVTVSRRMLDTVWDVAGPAHNVLILGTKDLALTVAREVVRRDDLGLRLVGFVEPGPVDRNASASIFGFPILGPVEYLTSFVHLQRVSRIVVALEDRRGVLPIRELVKLRTQGVLVEDAQSTISSLSGRIWLSTVRPSWFVFSDGFRRSGLTLAIKRLLDLMFGFLGLALSLPIMALAAIAIRLDSKGPVVFRQTRVGLKGVPFELLKLRSMRMDAEHANGAQWAEADDPRITMVGRFLRKFRVDEFPQFINVIRGDMSFVGPRPERPVFVEALGREISYYDERHSVRPGLTGWAQVQYRYGASVEDAYRKLEYDLFYLKNMSIMFDALIIFKTVRIVFLGEGGR